MYVLLQARRDPSSRVVESSYAQVTVLHWYCSTVRPQNRKQFFQIECFVIIFVAIRNSHSSCPIGWHIPVLFGARDCPFGAWNRVCKLEFNLAQPTMSRYLLLTRRSAWLQTPKWQSYASTPLTIKFGLKCLSFRNWNNYMYIDNYLLILLMLIKCWITLSV